MCDIILSYGYQYVMFSDEPLCIQVDPTYPGPTNIFQTEV